MVKTILPYRSQLKRLDVCGVGHSLVDVTVRVRDHELSQFGVKKGEQVFVSREQLDALLQRVSSHSQSVGVGGNVRNTLQGLARLGARTCYAATVGRDAYGRLMHDDLRRHHIQNQLFDIAGQSGVCLVLVTPDGERSLLTFPGDSVAVSNLPSTAIAHAKILYTTAYMMNDPHRRHLLERCMATAVRAETCIAFDLADVRIVQAYRPSIQKYIDAGMIQILLGNARELEQVFGHERSTGAPRSYMGIPIVVEKHGAEGALVVTQSEQYHIPPRCGAVVDTTGAGDLFAAGFLHGLLRGYPLETCGAFGSVVAGDKIRRLGIQLSENIRAQLRDCAATMSAVPAEAPGHAATPSHRVAEHGI